MRVAFIGGTQFVGPASVPLLQAAGHEVAVAHTGAHEHPATAEAEHLHGDRDALLGPGGLVERWQPAAIIDTFPGGASAEKAAQLAGCAIRTGCQRVVAISSIDVYQHCVESGLGDGSGTVALPAAPLPLDESSPLRTAPYPGASDGHDNAAMEAALRDAGTVTVLRPGAIYGPGTRVREWFLVEKIARGERALALPEGGNQFWHRVAVERLGRAIVSSLDHAPQGFWACNVVDPYDWSFAGLAQVVAEHFEWQWEPESVAFSDADHPWQTTHPVLVSDTRLTTTLAVSEPDPRDALAETLNWLWANREALSS